MKSILEFLIKLHIKSTDLSKILTGELVPYEKIKDLKKGTYFKMVKDDIKPLYGILNKIREDTRTRCVIYYDYGIHGDNKLDKDSLFGCDTDTKFYIMDKKDYNYFTSEFKKENIQLPELQQ